LPLPDELWRIQLVVGAATSVAAIGSGAAAGYG
jgi:hypothetical protein